jgi:hypothetical protein
MPESGLDIWLYFLRFAEKIDTEALLPALKPPSILRAVEELKMLTQTDIERERYESRRKAQQDHNSAINFASRQGEKIGAIRICERMLQRPQTPQEQLLALSPEDLNRLADDLEKQVLSRR